MCEHFREIVKRFKSFSQEIGICRGGFRGVKRTKKVNMLFGTILVIATGLFFSVLFDQYALAKKSLSCDKNKEWQIDPLEKINLSFFKEEDTKGDICEKKAEEEIIQKEKSPEEEKYEKLVQGYPIEEMISAISKQDKLVASFLIGIAKKESDWGKHSPQKNGKTCYNYWGYKGGYDPTDSGYSCFDSPEQAVEVVGGRIAELVGKKINTPQKMVVWKCGFSCAGHDPAGVQKWISDVSVYYDKLNS